MVYEYPVPYDLQRERAIVARSGEFTEIGNRLDILVVNSSALPRLLTEIDEAIQSKIFISEEGS